MKTITTTLLAMVVATAAVVSVAGCASTTGRPVGGHGPGAGSRPPHVAAKAARPLAQIVDLRAELPGNFVVTHDPSPVVPRSYDDALRDCVGVPRTSPDAVGQAAFEAGHDGQRSAVAVNTSIIRYRSQAPVDQDAALLLRLRAESCYRTVLLRLFRQYAAGAGVVADRTSVRASLAGEPVNVAGVVEFDFHTTLGGRHPGYTTTVFVTGPRTFGAIAFVGFGRTVRASTRDRLTALFAGRVAQG